jgi:hypothetical protein
MEWPHPREHYRIEYPTAARPTLIAGSVAHEVVDVSEQGLRFRMAQGESWDLGDTVAGSVRFQQRGEVRVSGVVVRIIEKEIAVRLSTGIPLKMIIDEQRYLREHHRGLAW